MAGLGLATKLAELEVELNKTKERSSKLEAVHIESEMVRRAKNPTGGVYLVKMGVHYKIGKANNFEQRIKQITLQMPEKGVEIHRIYTDDPIGIEAYWHKRFKDKRANGEWFTLSDEDVAIFKARDKM